MEVIRASYPEVLTLAEHLAQRHGVSAEHLTARDDSRCYRQLLETSLVGIRATAAAATATAAPPAWPPSPSASSSSAPSTSSSSAALGRRSLSDPTSRSRHGNGHGFNGHGNGHGNSYGPSATNDHGRALKRSHSLASGGARAQPPSRRVRRHRSLCSMAEVLDRVIDVLVTRAQRADGRPNVLSNGFRVRRAAESGLATVSRVECFFPNPLLAHLKAKEWDTLLLRAGDDVSPLLVASGCTGARARVAARSLRNGPTAQPPPSPAPACAAPRGRCCATCCRSTRSSSGWRVDATCS